MKMTLIRNYYLIIVAWAIYFNGYEILAFLLGVAGIIYLALKKDDINYWRVCAITLIISTLSFSLLSRSNIPYFFPSLKILLFIMAVNCALTNEHLYDTNVLFILSSLSLVALFVLGLSLVIYLLPGENYTLFTKRSLYLMTCFIFLPYITIMSVNSLLELKPSFLKKGGNASTRNSQSLL